MELKDIEILCGHLSPSVGLRMLKSKKGGEIQADVNGGLGAVPPDLLKVLLPGFLCQMDHLGANGSKVLKSLLSV